MYSILQKRVEKHKMITEPDVKKKQEKNRSAIWECIHTHTYIYNIYIYIYIYIYIFTYTEKESRHFKKMRKTHSNFYVKIIFLHIIAPLLNFKKNISFIFTNFKLNDIYLVSFINIFIIVHIVCNVLLEI